MLGSPMTAPVIDHSAYSAEGAAQPALALVRPRILVVTTLDQPSTIALHRAARWAEMFRAALHVLYVLPGGTQATFGAGQRETAEPNTPIDRYQHALTATKIWVEEGLGFELPVEQLHLAEGVMEDQISAVADSIDASFVILGEDHKKFDSVLRPRVATQVVRRSQRPVLIARSEELAHHLLAATDLSDPAYPALAYASSLAERTGAQLSFMHHVEHASSAFMVGREYAAKGSLHGRDLPTLATQMAEEQLERLTTLFGEQSEIIVTYRGDVINTIINVAEMHDADLIVLGVHDESATSHHPTGSVSYAVARRAPCSVLLVPLAAN